MRRGLNGIHARASSRAGGERGRQSAKKVAATTAAAPTRLMNDIHCNPLTTSQPHERRERPASSATARAARSLLLLAAALFFAFPAASESFAQKRSTESYKLRKNVSLHLTNRSGTITVEAWNKDEIRVAIEKESPSARVEPKESDEGLLIDVVNDNRGRPDVGDVNFRINVPVNTMVNLETRRGNITVRGVEGALMRAHVTSEGDIELIGVRASTVMAENTMGNIVFDAELRRGGTYELRSTQGDISIRISADSGFRLMGLGRNINLGPFGGAGKFQFMGEKRKVIGQVGDGAATLNVNNQFGTITFMRR